MSLALRDELAPLRLPGVTTNANIFRGILGDQTGLEVDPSKITSTKYNREIGVKFVPQDESTFPWPAISTSQISSHDLAKLETAVAHDKVIASKVISLLSILHSTSNFLLQSSFRSSFLTVLTFV